MEKRRSPSWLNGREALPLRPEPGRKNRPRILFGQLKERKRVTPLARHPGGSLCYLLWFGGRPLPPRPLDVKICVVEWSFSQPLGARPHTPFHSAPASESIVEGACRSFLLLSLMIRTTSFIILFGCCVDCFSRGSSLPLSLSLTVAQSLNHTQRRQLKSQ